MEINIGLSGEFKIVKEDADGRVLFDSDFQKNMILNQGLDLLAYVNGTKDVFANCIIGTGNSTPFAEQNTMDTPVAFAQRESWWAASKSDYVDGEQFYKLNKTFMYQFNGLKNVNVSEVGLAARVDSLANYSLFSRALIKDNQGNPSTITVLNGEILKIYYRVWWVFDTTDIKGTVNLVDGSGVSTPYNYTARLFNVGDAGSWLGYTSFGTSGSGIGYGLSLLRDRYIALHSGDIVSIKNTPNTEITRPSSASDIQFSNYINGSFKQIITPTWNIDAGNGTIRTVVYPTNLGQWQVRFGTADGDLPIIKKNDQRLIMPVEFTWGRFDGAL